MDRVSLEELARFLAADDQVRRLLALSTNALFTTVDGAVQLATSSDSAWRAILVEWRDYFERVEMEQREELLSDLASRVIREDYPKSLAQFLSGCTEFCFDRTCSEVPVFSRVLSGSISRKQEAPPLSTVAPIPTSIPLPSPVPSSSTPVSTSRAQGRKTKRPNLQNVASAGLSSKKAHEVLKLSNLIQQILLSDSSTSHYIIDIGSGRGHLSRSLRGLGLRVLAVDWDAGQTKGAERLDGMKDVLIDGKKGSLSHRTCSLDSGAIVECMAAWPGEMAEEGESGATLVALHACGDLTVDTLKAFVRAEQVGGGGSSRKLVCVGCCPHAIALPGFPLSTAVRLHFPPSSLARNDLVLSAQAPATWYLTPASIQSLKASLLKLAFRARLEAELLAAGPTEGVRIGRVGVCATYEEYRGKALGRIDNVLPDEVLPFEGCWDESMYYLRVLWTLKSLLGPVIESLVVLDRALFLCEELASTLEEGDAVEGEAMQQRSAEVINVFEQGSGSLRNLAIVVR